MQFDHPWMEHIGPRSRAGSALNVVLATVFAIVAATVGRELGPLVIPAIGFAAGFLANAIDVWVAWYWPDDPTDELTWGDGILGFPAVARFLPTSRVGSLVLVVVLVAATLIAATLVPDGAARTGVLIGGLVLVAAAVVSAVLVWRRWFRTPVWGEG